MMLVVPRGHGTTRPENGHSPIPALDGAILTNGDVAAMPMQTDDVMVIGTALNTYRLGWHDDNHGPAALDMQPGRIVVTPPGIAHRAAWELHAVFAVAFLDLNETAQRSGQALCADEIEIPSLTGQLDHDAGELIVSLARATKRVAYDQTLQELSTHVLRRYAEVREKPDRLSRGERQFIVSLIDSRLADDCSVEMIARAVGYSRRHFARRFKGTFGTSVHRFVVRRRVARVRTLLACTTQTINAIAAEVGFVSGAHLAASFGLDTGSSPSRYRVEPLEPKL